MTETATFASGCFWCGEAVFNQLKGVTKVTSGFTGGETPNPSYWDVASGMTAHTEAIQIEFDPEIITYAQLLDVFWTSHDPTSLNRQGYDAGPQYRSEIFYHSEGQKEEAERSKHAVQSSFEKPIVTPITEFKEFYPATEDQQDFYEKHPEVAYCQIIIDPKIQKLREKYKPLLKDETN